MRTSHELFSGPAEILANFLAYHASISSLKATHSDWLQWADENIPLGPAYFQTFYLSDRSKGSKPFGAGRLLGPRVHIVLQRLYVLYHQLSKINIFWFITSRVKNY